MDSNHAHNATGLALKQDIQDLQIQIDELKKQLAELQSASNRVTYSTPVHEA